MYLLAAISSTYAADGKGQFFTSADVGALDLLPLSFSDEMLSLTKP
jgi:hypothetical protein